MNAMTSKERLLAAMRKAPVDRVPVPQVFWLWSPEHEMFRWADLEAKTAWHKRLGFDHYLSLPSVGRQNPEIVERHWQEKSPDEECAILCSEWSSPKGTLTAKLRLSEDYPGQKINLFSDFNTARYVKPLLGSAADLETFVRMDFWKLRAGDELEEWRSQCRFLKQHADAEGLAVSCDAGMSLDYLIQGSTAEQGILLAVEHPEETMHFMRHVNKHFEDTLPLYFEAGADFVHRRGWYDSTDCWSPSQFVRFAAPFIQKMTQLAHQAGLPCRYQMCTGIMPLLPELAKLDFDCLMGVEPVCTGQDMGKIVEALGDRKSFWTGLSAPLHIGMGSTEDVRKAVRKAFDIFGHRGFLLSAVPSIRRNWPWENVEAMMDEYRAITAETH